MIRNAPTSPQFQTIYAASLRMPFEGYAGSSKFRPSIGPCPSCGAVAYVRIRFRTGTVIGCACGSCPWFMTYVLTPKLPPSPIQTLLEL